MSTELPTRPTCPACGSTKVGTLAKQITKDTAWRCASCGETFKLSSPVRLQSGDHNLWHTNGRRLRTDFGSTSCKVER